MRARKYKIQTMNSLNVCPLDGSQMKEEEKFKQHRNLTIIESQIA